jgi:hypothetical protein
MMSLQNRTLSLSSLQQPPSSILTRQTQAFLAFWPHYLCFEGQVLELFSYNVFTIQASNEGSLVERNYKLPIIMNLGMDPHTTIN